MKKNGTLKQTSSNAFLLQELSSRLAQETGLEFMVPDDGLRKNGWIPLCFDGPEGEIKLAYRPPEGKILGTLTSRLLNALGREIYASLGREITQATQEQGWTWEKLLATAMEQQWDEAVFESKAIEYSLPKLGLGVPCLIRCQTWHNQLLLVIGNLLPTISILWVRHQEIFLFVRVEKTEVKENTLNELQRWGESLIQFIHSRLADELGVLASVFIGHLTTGELWQGYREVQELVELQTRFFPGETGLAVWKLRLAGLLGEVSQMPIQRYQREVLKDAITAELYETLETYLSHNLSISETARTMFIHRNTLVYRLDRITELTGYDPRKFEEVVHLYIAIWLKRHAQ